MFTKKVKGSFFLVVLLFGAWIGRGVYLYFSHEVPPQISFSGIKPDGCCKAEVPCEIKCESGYSVGAIDAFVDGKRIDTKEVKKINKKSYVVFFDLDTSELADGKHSIEITAKDGSYKKNESEFQFDFSVDNVSLKAALLQSEYKIEQGHTLHVRINANKSLAKAQVKFLSGVYDCYQESNFSPIYECFIPVECECSASEHLLTAEVEDAPGNNLKLSSNVKIEPFSFVKQRGFSVSKEKLEEDRDVGISDKVMEEALVKWLKDSPNEKLWSGSFEKPINVKRVATPFGEIRMTPEKGRYLHKAVDLIDFPRSVVWASEKGRVIIKDRYVMSGNTVVLDHGLGVFSMYFHLEDFADIEIGDLVKKGNPVGKLGKTGYATGYHLHWEIRVNNVAINPLQWAEKNF